MSLSTARDAAANAAAVSWLQTRLAKYIEPESEVCIWIGAAGFSAATVHQFRRLFAPFAEALCERADTVDASLDVFVANDAVSLLKAPPLLGTGVAAIVGTGSVVLGAHPSHATGVIKRGGYEWIASDEGSGVWMTIQAMRRILDDIAAKGSVDYHSPLLDRLVEHFDVDDDDLASVPESHQAIARIDAVCRKSASIGRETKRELASFVYPNLFDLVNVEDGGTHDVLAERVIRDSVHTIAQNVEAVSEILAASTADAPSNRDKLAVSVGGNIARNSYYSNLLSAEIGQLCEHVDRVRVIGDASGCFAELASAYLNGSKAERKLLAKDCDPLHPILQLV
jgi:N-acetylglucosamine kinase-like BadF-type ATPase